jgi:hypothetical protein
MTIGVLVVAQTIRGVPTAMCGLKASFVERTLMVTSAILRTSHYANGPTKVINLPKRYKRDRNGAIDVQSTDEWGFSSAVPHL